MIFFLLLVLGIGITAIAQSSEKSKTKIEGNGYKKKTKIEGNTHAVIVSPHKRRIYHHHAKKHPVIRHKRRPVHHYKKMKIENKKGDYKAKYKT